MNTYDYHRVNEERSDIYTVKPDGSSRRRLTHTGNTGEPAWSPDGEWVAFVRGSNQSTPAEGLWVMRPDGSHQRRLSNRNVAGPDWSPDGSKILVSTPRSGGISVYDVRDGSLRVVFRPAGRIADTFSPKWSADGRRIAFGATLEGEGPDDYTSDMAIFTMDLNGNHLHRVPHTRDLLGFDWSLVDDRILFGSGLATRGGDCNGDLFVTTPTGSPLVRVLALPCRERSPAWRPDGNAITFVENQYVGSELYVADSDGHHLRLVVPRRHNESISYSPAWQPLTSPNGK